ncbi:MAG: hypothetical protein OHK0022_00420 [Roseiflexaceae bacterium]
MPNVRKLSPDEVRTIEGKVKGQRKLIEEQYDQILREYNEGDYGEAELEPNENRITVRNRLKAAAARAGKSLDFKRTKGDLLRFKVVARGQIGSDGDSDSDDEAVESAAPPRRGRGRGRKKELV